MVVRTLRVALVGDFDPSVVAHQAIPKALNLAGTQHGVEVEPVWVHTSSIIACGRAVCRLRRHLVRAGESVCEHAGCAGCDPLRAGRRPPISRHVRRVSARAARVRAECLRNAGGGACRDGSWRAAAADCAACLLAGGAERRDPAGGRRTVSPRPTGRRGSPRAITAVTVSIGSTNRASFATVCRRRLTIGTARCAGWSLPGILFLWRRSFSRNAAR